MYVYIWWFSTGKDKSLSQKIKNKRNDDIYKAVVEIQQKRNEFAEFMQNQHRSLPYEHNQNKINKKYLLTKIDIIKMLHQ